MKKLWIIPVVIVVIVGIFFIYDSSKQKITNFDECVAFGNPVMESYPRQCRANDQTFVEEIVEDLKNIKCLPEQRGVDACIEIYQPVCGTVNIQCFKAPCNPVKETFENSCKACANSLVDNYSMGEC